MREETDNKKQVAEGRGFSLMEVIIAIAVITTALIGAIALISFSVSGIGRGKTEIIATNLAQEGLEIVRNIRDSNWLGPTYKRSPSNWRDGLGAGNHRVQYNRPGLLSPSSQKLKIDSNGFYQYDNGTATPFTRTIAIEYIGNNQIKVTSQVSWQEKGKSRVVQAEDRLYNWLEE